MSLFTLMMFLSQVAVMLSTSRTCLKSYVAWKMPVCASRKINAISCNLRLSLGHTISSRGVQPTRNKVEAIRNAPTPTNVHQLKSFLGLMNFYAKFFPNSATTLAPLYSLLQKAKPGYVALINTVPSQQPNHFSLRQHFWPTIVTKRSLLWLVKPHPTVLVQYFLIEKQMAQRSRSLTPLVLWHQLSAVTASWTKNLLPLFLLPPNFTSICSANTSPFCQTIDLSSTCLGNIVLFLPWLHHVSKGGH